MSKTPRTDEKEFAAIDLKPSARVVYASFCRQLETELADKDKQLAEARAEIENLKWQVNNEKAKAEAALALNDRALELVNEARAEIFELKKGAESDTGTILRQANSIRTIGEELADKDKQLAKAQAEIERKSKLIEQMRTTLIAAKNDLLRVCDDAPDHRTKMCIDFIDSALAAERKEL